MLIGARPCAISSPRMQRCHAEAEKLPECVKERNWMSSATGTLSPLRRSRSEFKWLREQTPRRRKKNKMSQGPWRRSRYRADVAALARFHALGMPPKCLASFVLYSGQNRGNPGIGQKVGPQMTDLLPCSVGRREPNRNPRLADTKISTELVGDEQNSPSLAQARPYA